MPTASNRTIVYHPLFLPKSISFICIRKYLHSCICLSRSKHLHYSIDCPLVNHKSLFKPSELQDNSQLHHIDCPYATSPSTVPAPKTVIHYQVVLRCSLKYPRPYYPFSAHLLIAVFKTSLVKITFSFMLMFSCSKNPAQESHVIQV